MSRAESGKFASGLVTLGTLSGALSKWYLVWLFSQTSYGAEAVGLYSLVLAVATPIFVVAELGLRTIFVSHATQWPWASYMRLRILGAVLGTGLLLLYAVLSPGVPEGLVVAIAFLKVATSIADIFAAKLQFFNQMRTLGTLSLTSAVLNIVSTSLVVFLLDSVEVTIWVSGIISIAVGFISWCKTLKFTYLNTESKNATAQILRSSVPVTAAQLLATLLFQIPILIVGVLADPKTVGIFVSAAYILTIASMIGATLQTVLVTPFRNWRAKFGDLYIANQAGRITRKVALAGFLGSCIAIPFGPNLILLVYGPDFIIGWETIALLMISAVATTTAFIYSVTLNVLNRYGTIVWSFIISCVVTLLAGVLGAALQVDVLLIGAASAALGALSRFLTLWSFTRFSLGSNE